MQPLNMLTNVQKARLLHSLFLNEIPEFLGYLNELTKSILNDKQRIAEQWDSPMLGFGFWLELTEEVQRVVGEYPKELYKNSVVFAEQLFGGYNAIFTAYALTQYVALGKHIDPKFKIAVELFFA